MIDMYAFPVVERIYILENSPWNDTFVKLDFKNLAPNAYNYSKNFRDHPKLKD